MEIIYQIDEKQKFSLMDERKAALVGMNRKWEAEGQKEVLARNAGNGVPRLLQDVESFLIDELSIILTYVRRCQHRS